MNRRTFLISLISLPLAGCSLSTKIADGYCEHISCNQGMVSEIELRKVIKNRIERSAKKAREYGITLSSVEVEKRMEIEFREVKTALRKKSVKVVDFAE